ncbi:MAG TPA: winged helix-turn-helix domain-containing protein, partial [Bryobacteraceae bacterium]
MALGTAPYFWYTQPTIMEPGAVFSHLVRFGLFELDLQTAELSKNGRKLKLQEQPFRLLALLLEHPGEVVTREQLKIALWPEDTFVDFEHSVNAAVAKLRQTLGDSAENPRFIATVPRRGYRFIAPVEGVDPVPRLSRDNTTEPAVVIGKDQPRPGDRWSRRFTLLVVSGVAVAIIAGVAILFLQATRQHGRAPYTVMRRLTADDGLTTDPAVSPDGTLLAYASDRGGKGRLNLWVQQLSGGSTIRLTNSDADDRQPSFSPDGTQIVFRSERRGGGLYVVPTLGGEARFVAKDGRDPHFSPDGKWIAYWVGNITDDSLNTGEVFVIPSSGGVPQALKTDMHLGYPLWSPDGEHLLVLAATTYGAEKDLDWWVFAREGDRNVRTGAFRLLQKQGFPLTQTSGGYPPRVMQWVGNDLLFSARFGDSTDIWAMHLSPRSWQVEGTARRLTSGPAIEDHPQLLPDGRIVFTDLARSSNLWALSIDANEGKPRTDVLQRITDKVSLEQFGSISGDGRYLVFTSTRSTGQAHVWLKDLSTGRESRLNRTEEEEEHPVISHDGTLVACSDQHGVSVVPRVAHGAPESLCEKCG